MHVLLASENAVSYTFLSYFWKVVPLHIRLVGA